jgi:hypothetical protein
MAEIYAYLLLYTESNMLLHLPLYEVQTFLDIRSKSLDLVAMHPLSNLDSSLWQSAVRLFYSWQSAV